MGLGILHDILKSECKGIGYWTHFIIGAVLGILLVAKYRTAHALGWTFFLGYQIADFFYGTELIYSPEGALARDVGEYAIGYAFVLIGAALERRNHHCAIKQS